MTKPPANPPPNPPRRPAIVELPEGPAADDAAPRRRAPASEGLSEPGPSPAEAPRIDDPAGAAPSALAMTARLLARPTSWPTRLLVGSGAALVSFLLVLSVLRFIDAMLLRWPLLGWIATGLAAVFVLAVLVAALREGLAFRRLARIDALQRQAGAALANADRPGAQAVLDGLDRLYADRPELAWHRARLREQAAEAPDAQALLHLAEAALFPDLDEAARREVEAAARLVAATTALIPLTFVDVATALLANLRMIRRLAVIYGGRAGWLGGWRLARLVLAHLVATGAVAAGDDLLPSIAGGGALAKLSRRFGEGVVNAALTARVGIAAIEVCRPLPFLHQPRPRVTQMLGTGLRGLFTRD